MIKKVAVIGSGTMGRMIAEHISFCGTEVLLLDISSPEKEDRSIIAKQSVEKMKYRKGAVSHGNLDDDLAKLKDADWIIEVIVENLDIKQKLYKQIIPFLKPGAVLSSNTSTILRADLVKSLPTNIANNFIVTHFFNPPRHLLLMELVWDEKSKNNNTQAVVDFCQDKLGRFIVRCNDTCGFIGNRIGCFWLLVALCLAVEMKVNIENADQIMNTRHIGIPKTGVFGLLDLIGIDVFVAITDFLKKSLPKSDAIHSYQIPKLIYDMIADGHTGNKKKSGFYRDYKKTDYSVRQSMDLSSGLYMDSKPVEQLATKTLTELLGGNTTEQKYAKRVWEITLEYTANLIPEISEDISIIDETMVMGYNWSQGPFKLMDTMIHEGSLPPSKAAILKHNKPLYQGNKRLTLAGDYIEITSPQGFLSLQEVARKRNNTPLITNASASLWDIGDGIACFGFTSRNNCFDESMLRLINDAINIVGKNFDAMIIANDSPNFSVGANLKIFLKKSFDYTDKIIGYGQETFLRLKTAPFPVIAAISGFAVGGGCELTLHCDAIQAYKITNLGLVEANIGVIPGWGGCKEMLLRYKGSDDFKKLFMQIFEARLSKDSDELYDMRILREGIDGVSDNRCMLMHDAKQRALAMLKKGYKPPKIVRDITMQGAKVELPADATEHDKLIAAKLHDILSCQTKNEEAVLKKEREHFMSLLKTPKTQERIDHMLNKKTKLHN